MSAASSPRILISSSLSALHCQTSIYITSFSILYQVPSKSISDYQSGGTSTFDTTSLYKVPTTQRRLLKAHIWLASKDINIPLCLGSTSLPLISFPYQSDHLQPPISKMCSYVVVETYTVCGCTYTSRDTRPCRGEPHIEEPVSKIWVAKCPSHQ